MNKEATQTENWQTQCEYWDSVVSQYHYHSDFQPCLFLKHITSLATILDFGCGYGRILQLLLQLYCVKRY